MFFVVLFLFFCKLAFCTNQQNYNFVVAKGLWNFSHIAHWRFCKLNLPVMQPFCFQSIPLFSYTVSSSTLNITDCNTVNNSVVKSHGETESHLLSPCSNFIRLEGKKKYQQGNETVFTLYPKSPGTHLGISNNNNNNKNLQSQVSHFFGNISKGRRIFRLYVGKTLPLLVYTSIWS